MRVNGLDALALTKLDVLDGLAELQVCTAYRAQGRDPRPRCRETRRSSRRASPSTRRCPAGANRQLGLTKLDALPREASAWVARLEEITGVPAVIVSTGSDRDHTILREGVLSPALAIR